MIHWGGLTSASSSAPPNGHGLLPQNHYGVNEKSTPNLLVWTWFKVVKSMSPTKKKKIELWMSLYISWLLDWAVIDTTLLKGEGV